MDILITPPRASALAGDLPRHPPHHLPERIAAAIGARLIAWATRPRAEPAAPDPALLREQRDAREAREAHWRLRAAQQSFR